MDTVDILMEFKCLNKMTKKINTIQKMDLNCLHVDYEIFEHSKKNLNTNLLPLPIQNKKELKNHRLAYIYDLISVDPISINELCKKTSKPISQISNDLLLLELEGYIQKVAGGYICTLNK